MKDLTKDKERLDQENKSVKINTEPITIGFNILELIRKLTKREVKKK